MRRTSTRVITMLATLAISANVVASTPVTSPVLKTGQVICYDQFGGVIGCAGTGQDGELQLGLERSFTDNGDGTITDNVTGLMWEKQSEDGSIHDWRNTYTWLDAFGVKIATLNSDHFAGHGDWRLPNIRELETISNFAVYRPAAYGIFHTDCLPGCTILTCSCTRADPSFYWSSTTTLELPYRASVKNSAWGTSDASDKVYSCGVRAVRGDSIVLKTGQTTCYGANGETLDCAGTGQDGELQKGVERSFRDNGDGTITDNATGLMWEKHSDDGSIHDQDNRYPWMAVQTGKISTLNSDGFAGYTDWRWPNTRELFSLSNFGSVKPAVFNAFDNACAPGCTVATCSCTQWAETWYLHGSSTSTAGVPSDVIGVEPRHGGEVGLPKSISWNVRAVRGGIPLCGNGVVESGEDCDDGNAVVGDCCSPTCQVEPASTICREAAGPCDYAEYCDGVAGACPADGGNTADGWVPTASMSSRRWMHTATRLPDGRVLVVGGYDGSAIVATAEIWDPALASWYPTGSMGTIRFTHTATLLRDGRVLVIGGDDGHSMGDRLSSVELYDPALGTWSPTGSMGSVRESAATTVLQDGRVLVSGGGYANGGYWSSAEIYDPATGTWTPTGSMGTPRYAHTSTLLPDGRVLVTGGTYAYPPNLFTNTAEIYDPATGGWSPTAPMSVARYGHTASLLPEGRVLIVGGSPDNSIAWATAEVYDPVLGTWSPTEAMGTPRYFHTATLLPTGQVLVAGGHRGGLPPWDNNAAVTSAEIYDPALGNWTATPPMNEGRYTHTATLLEDGRVLLVGAYDDTDLAAATAEIYTTDTACLECGNGTVEFGESCDDGNLFNGDCCSAACHLESVSSVCRPSAGPCDAAETCTGTTPTCPSDALAEVGASCTSDDDECTDDVCDTEGACVHSPIPLAPTCKWAIIDGSDDQAGHIRTRGDSEVDGGICADTADIGENSALLGSSSWALLEDTEAAARVRPGAVVINGSVATGGGCLTGLHGAAVFGTIVGPVCCADGDVPLPGGESANVINACGTNPLIERCMEARDQLASDVSLLDSLPATRTLGPVLVGTGGTQTIQADPGLNVMEADRIVVKKGGTLVIDAQSDPGAVIILRLANGISGKMRARIVLAGGAMPENVLFYAPSGNCTIGWGNEGAGTLFCPAGKVRMRVDALWSGAIAGGATVDIGWNARLTHVPFLGLAQ